MNGRSASRPRLANSALTPRAAAIGAMNRSVEPLSPTSRTADEGHPESAARQRLVAAMSSHSHGPGGGSAEKPVGLVWFGLASKAGTTTEKKVFSGDREAVRSAAIEHALQLLLASAKGI